MFLSYTSPAWRLSFCPEGPCRCERRPPPLRLRPAASTSRPSSSPPLWTHLGWPDCHLCPAPRYNTNTFTQITFIYGHRSYCRDIIQQNYSLPLLYKTDLITGVSVYGLNKYCTTFWFLFTMRTYFHRKPNVTRTHFSFFGVHFHSDAATLFFFSSILATLLAATLKREEQFTKPWMKRFQGFPCTLAETCMTCLF